MNELMIFDNSQFGAIRAIEKDGDPWFVAADVCRALEHSNVSMALDRLDDDEKAKLNLGLASVTFHDGSCVPKLSTQASGLNNESLLSLGH